MPLAVYPRPRGEYSMRLMPAILMQGLPPPTRGIPPLRPQSRVGFGSTPAHAGNTIALGGANSWTRVYPRPRGEYLPRLALRLASGGLPPPTRGIPLHRCHGCDRGWSTPAHAGNTWGQASPYTPAPVYPRPRGEYTCAIRHVGIVHGLPPPTRGILGRLAGRHRRDGSTPAHAGNTQKGTRKNSPIQVYPRPRGEYPVVRPADAAVVGLPPPTRGIHGRIDRIHISFRSTPAHAGNTLADRRPRAHWRVYPRPRGEY